MGKYTTAWQKYRRWSIAYSMSWIVLLIILGVVGGISGLISQLELHILIGVSAVCFIAWQSYIGYKIKFFICPRCYKNFYGHGKFSIISTPISHTHMPDRCQHCNLKRYEDDDIFRIN